MTASQPESTAMPALPSTLGIAPIVYFVYWPAISALKIGRANHMGRVRKHLKTGGIAVALLRNRPAIHELRGQRALEQRFPRRFKSWRDAVGILGDAGSGYSECYRVEAGDLQYAVDAALVAIARG